MFQHILVPVDGSGTSEVAVGKAIELARAFGSTVTVIYVIDPYPFTGVGTDFAYGQAEYLSAATAEANASVHAAKEAFANAGVAVDTSVIEAHTAWRGIVEAGASLEADLIVMGSHGRSGLEKLVLGSVAQAVLSHTKLPVLVVRS
ncbi:MAG: universal stress protein [Rhodoferax sp.]|jgi:nucleotide-binding universal stress UspA family protein|uniref:universal stress protein n=1 Tax=Rhodoferax sp. TaxID=50421 RepID=UPI001B774819|nr:universal stress protein [Rhodoferax sp.]MBP9147786.1 universal stress protein [Rhodoferax sp.]MBP9736302.1 universal stress protein [Rhodoferax sp.]